MIKNGVQRYLKPILAVAMLVVVMIFLASYWQFLPSVPGFSNTYKRGAGDSILKYEDRTYESASWKKLKKGDSLSAMIPVANKVKIGKLVSIAGWDRNSFWVLDNLGSVIESDEGHWEYRAKLDSSYYTQLRLLEKGTALCIDRYGSSMHLVSHQGVESFEVEGRSSYSSNSIIAPIASDLFYFMRSNDVIKVADGKVTKLVPDKYKEATVHRDDNTPLSEYLVKNLLSVCSTAPGQAIGIVNNTKKSGKHKVVEFREGIWYSVDDFTKEYRKVMNDVWYGFEDEKPKFFIAVGSTGWVYSKTIDGKGLEQSINSAQETTSMNLIAVWGVNAKKYWVMDSNGTVWHRSDQTWRVVVRGLYMNDVKFKDAWVSPTGVVIAITDEDVYRLE